MKKVSENIIRLQCDNWLIVNLKFCCKCSEYKKWPNKKRGKCHLSYNDNNCKEMEFEKIYYPSISLHFGSISRFLKVMNLISNRIRIMSIQKRLKDSVPLFEWIELSQGLGKKIKNDI